MKEDVLEQIVDDYLKLTGYFTIHNVKFKPSPEHGEFLGSQDSVASDIDVLGVNPRLRRTSRSGPFPARRGRQDLIPPGS